MKVRRFQITTQMSVLAHSYSERRRSNLNANAIEFHPGQQCHPLRPPTYAKRRMYNRTKFNPEVQRMLSSVNAGLVPKLPKEAKEAEADLQNYLEQMGVMKKNALAQAQVKEDKTQIVQQLFKQVHRTRLISRVF